MRILARWWKDCGISVRDRGFPLRDVQTAVCTSVWLAKKNDRRCGGLTDIRWLTLASGRGELESAHIEALEKKKIKENLKFGGRARAKPLSSGVEDYSHVGGFGDLQWVRITSTFSAKLAPGSQSVRPRELPLLLDYIHRSIRCAKVHHLDADRFRRRGEIEN
jgi:hypothetical protein